MDIKWYKIENMGGNTMAFFGEFNNGLYFCGNENGLNILKSNAHEIMCSENSENIDIDNWFDVNIITSYEEDSELYNEIVNTIKF